MRPVDIGVLRIEWAHIPAATFRRWAREGKIKRHGRDERGRTLYDRDEVSKIVAALARQP